MLLGQFQAGQLLVRIRVHDDLAAGIDGKMPVDRNTLVSAGIDHEGDGIHLMHRENQEQGKLAIRVFVYTMKGDEN